MLQSYDNTAATTTYSFKGNSLMLQEIVVLQFITFVGKMYYNWMNYSQRTVKLLLTYFSYYNL